MRPRALMSICHCALSRVGGARGERGFTLVELMVVLVVAAVLLGIAVPSMSQFTLSGKLRAYSNEIVAGVALARSEAIKRNRPVRLCVANADGDDCEAGGWENGWIVITSDDEVLLRQQAIDDGFKIISAEDELSFQASGVGSTSATLTVCRATPSVGDQERIVTISATGRTTVTKPSSPSTCS